MRRCLRTFRARRAEGEPALKYATALLVLLAACGGNPLPEWKTDPMPSPNAKRVDHLEKISNTLTWQRSPYFRIDDKVDVPVYLIVADDHTACVAPPEDWTIANHGDFYPCPGKWRIRRG